MRSQTWVALNILKKEEVFTYAPRPISLTAANSEVGKTMVYEVFIVQEGYYKELEDGCVKKNCTCALIKGKVNVIVDTLTPWDKQQILAELKKHKLRPCDIKYVISTQPSYGFSGNNHLFRRACHIVGHAYTQRNTYLFEPFTHDGDDLKVIPTSGCTLKDVSVLVKTVEGTVAVTGALFENKDDLKNDYETIRFCNGSFFPQLQIHSRRLIVKLADYIIPGYGGMFQVTEDIKNSFVDRNTSLI
ncbi:metallo-beta-lactamase domain-containing protein 1 isoform X2 [Halyomorpha halys]|uniref:metallo-beta-lactamase domain-containing protein 1 isoform X2 n=1 Tax=Halyomorpha halys TaxID=286706 RepID=UPI0034D1E5EC